MQDETKYTKEEYEAMVEKIKQGTATEEEKAAIEELALNAMKEIENILDEDSK